VSEIRGLGRETLVYMLASLGQAAAGLAAFYYFSRLLTPDQYGYYFVALAPPRSPPASPSAGSTSR